MSPARQRLLLAGLIVAATAARAWRLDGLSLWFDEGWSAFAAGQASPWAAAAADPTNPPLYYLLLHLLARGAGTSELALRWGSVLLGAVALALVAALARALGGPRAARYGLALAAASPLLWWAAREARMYSLLAAAAALAAYGWLRLGRAPAPAPAAWAALVTGELAALFGHHSGPVLVLALNLATGLGWLGRQRPRRPHWRGWLASQALVLALWAPFGLAPFLSLDEANASLRDGPTLGPALLLPAWEVFWSGSWAIVGHEPALAALAGLMALLAVLLLPWRMAAARRLALLWALSVAGLVAALAVLGNPLHGRYLVISAPLLLAPLGAGIARLGRRPLRWLALAPSVAALAMVAGLTLTRPGYGNDDARGLVRALATRLGPGDTLLAWSYADRYELAYYWEREGPAARRLTLPEGADLAAVAPRLPRAGRLALNVWYGQRADYRGMLGCLLGHGGGAPPERLEVPGMSTFLYDAPRPLPAPRALGAAFAGGRVVEAGEAPAGPGDRAACLPVGIALDATTPGDLAVALIAHGPLGNEIAHVDAVAADAAQRTSRQARSVAAFPLLRLPVGTPPGRYPLALRVYLQDPATGGAVKVLGADIPLGEWRVTPGGSWATAAGPPAPDLPRTVELPVGAGLTLVAHDAPQGEGPGLTPGDTLPLTLLWRGRGRPPALLLEDGAGARSGLSPTLAVVDGLGREWRPLRVPLDSPDGALTLRLADGRPLGSYPVRALPPVVREAPDLALSLDRRFDGAGSLLGLVGAPAPLRAGEILSVELAWRVGEATPGARYTVFVQLLGADGQVLAQHDGPPAGGERPTTSWRPGEVVLDAHALALPPGARGPARLIAGLYDPRTGERLRAADGADHAVLATGLDIR